MTKKGGETSDQTYKPTSDESLFAAISHFFGLLMAFIVWVSQKDKSRFVRVQSIQAMAYDLSTGVIMLFAVGLTLIIILSVLAFGVSDMVYFGSQNNPAAGPVRTVVALMTAAPFLIPCIFVPMGAFFFVVRLIATVETFQGKNFHYPWLGKWVEKSLSL